MAIRNQQSISDEQDAIERERARVETARAEGRDPQELKSDAARDSAEHQRALTERLKVTPLTEKERTVQDKKARFEGQDRPQDDTAAKAEAARLAARSPEQVRIDSYTKRLSDIVNDINMRPEEKRRIMEVVEDMRRDEEVARGEKLVTARSPDVQPRRPV